jgi:3-dehydroquinate synthase
LRALEIHGSRGDSSVVIGRDLLNRPVPAEKTIAITDSTVRHLYQKDFPPCEVIEIGVGERVKNLDTLKDIHERLVGLEADRSSFILGIGGGVVCDIAGFAASTYMRGLRFGLIPTTLLSQADAGVGGKNGVNLGGYKNLVGTFNQPEFVFCDLNLLRTLPEREILCGFAEFVKHAAIADLALFSYLEENHEGAVALEAAVMERLVHDSILIKSSIVNRDEREEGERRLLNFGHTFGHAIEKATGASHGVAVSAGMVIASRLSVQRGTLAPDDAGRLEALVRKLKLPTRITVNRESVLDALSKDKKKKGKSISFVLLQAIGRAVLEDIPIEDLEKAAREVL